MQGQVLTWNLAKCADVTEIVLGDYDLERARFVAAQVGGGKTTAVRLDASDQEALIQAAQGFGLVMNAVIPEFNIPIMRACLSSSALYATSSSRSWAGAAWL